MNADLGLYGALVLIIVMIISSLASLHKGKRATLSSLDYANVALNAVAVVSGGALIVGDLALQITAPLHWLVLLAYLVLLIIFSALRHIGGSRIVLFPMAVVSALMVILMLADIFLNLPLSSYYNSLPNFGTSYLLGFGRAGTASIFWVSLAFVLLLASSALQSLLSVIIYSRKTRS